MSEVKTAQKSHGLMLIIGKAGSGKSKFLHNYSQDKGIPILDFDLIFGKEIPEGKDSSYVYDRLKGFLSTYTPSEILLDKKKILYQENSDIDLLDFLQDLAKNKKVIATWNGYIEGDKLIHICDALGKTLEYDLASVDCTYMEIK